MKLKRIIPPITLTQPAVIYVSCPSPINKKGITKDKDINMNDSPFEYNSDPWEALRKNWLT